MKKILGVVGSPRRKGNTHILLSKILEGAQSEGISTDIIFLNDLTIEECDGCHYCWKNEKCIRKDDMSDLYEKIIESDVIVFGTPVYWYGPTALMKCFIDRFVYFNGPKNRKKIKDKSAIIAVPFEEENYETVAPVISFFEKSLNFLGVKLIGKIIAPGVTKRGEVKEKKEYMEEAYKLGKKAAKVMKELQN
jgi:multimeric flavodoxin WrbA